MTKKLIQDVPEMKVYERDLTDFHVVPAKGFQVCSWRDGPAHSDIPASEVHIVLPLDGKDLEGVKVALRLRSARALDELVAVLLQHRKDVWPE